jgi:hypothetical protein
MEILKDKQFWISSLTTFLGITLFSRLFNKGWDLMMGDIAFEEAFQNFEIRPVWIVISIAIAFYNTRKRHK